MSRDGGLGRNDLCPCRSGKKYKKCCYPRAFPDFSKPNAGLPDPFEEQEAGYRALSRQESQPQQGGVTIDTVDVGRTRLLCAPLVPYGGELGLPGTLAPPTPLQVEQKYEEIRAGNPDGVTELVVTYTYPEMFGFAEARMVLDADEHFRLVDGRILRVLDLFRGMHVVTTDGNTGTIVGNPERRYDIPVPPLPDENGLWSSRVVGRVRHTAHEIVEFRWAGEMVRVTPGHAVWSQSRSGWVGAHELFRGEMIRVAGSVVAPVEGARRMPGLIEVFGIEVEYFHNYFVGTGPDAMLVHNGPPCINKPVAETTQARLNYHTIFRLRGVGGNGAASEIHSLAGMSRADAAKALEAAGFRAGTPTTGGWQTFKHADGSKIDIGPGGRVVRSAAPRYGTDGGRINRGQRLALDGSEIPRSLPHNQHPPELLTGN